MTELPVEKAGWADQLSAVKGEGVRAERISLTSGRRRPLAVRPSTETGMSHGFASLVKFFPAGKAWLAGLEEKLWKRLGAGDDVFDDQYMSTGGQLYELMMGRDRFIADLRPLAFARLGIAPGLCCHPYDICTALIAREAGCIVCDPDGKIPGAPLDTTTAVAWTGYANRKLARKIGPTLRRLLAD
jgi:hypothetical protein